MTETRLIGSQREWRLLVDRANARRAPVLPDVRVELVRERLDQSQQRHRRNLPKPAERQLDDVPARPLDQIKVLIAAEAVADPIEDFDERGVPEAAGRALGT